MCSAYIRASLQDTVSAFILCINYQHFDRSPTRKHRHSINNSPNWPYIALKLKMCVNLDMTSACPKVDILLIIVVTVRELHDVEIPVRWGVIVFEKEIMECNLRCASFDFHLLIVNENFITDAIAENQTCPPGINWQWMFFCGVVGFLHLQGSL